jgi:hypothetical protein
MYTINPVADCTNSGPADLWQPGRKIKSETSARVETARVMQSERPISCGTIRFANGTHIGTKPLTILGRNVRRGSFVPQKNLCVLKKLANSSRKTRVSRNCQGAHVGTKRAEQLVGLLQRFACALHSRPLRFGAQVDDLVNDAEHFGHIGVLA